MKNANIVSILRNIAFLLEMEDGEEDNSTIIFKIRSYKRASDTIANLSSNLEEIYKEQGLKGLMQIPSIGKAIALKIEEYLSPQQTPVGIYNVHLIASIIQPITATLTKPIFNNKVSGFIDPEFFASKKYPSIEYLTSLTNLTITVIPPLNVNDQFKNFWGTYGQPISIIVGGFASLIFSRMDKKT